MELIATPLKSRQRGFVLTSLIDVIFLLLVFFMLSSQIAPYSMLTVSGGVTQSGDTSQAAAADAALPKDKVELMFIISRGHVRSGPATIPLDQLPHALSQMKDPHLISATVLTTRSATVQDVVTALEVFETARVANVRLLMSPS